MLPFFQALAQASTRDSIEIRGVNNTLAKLGRFVAAPNNGVQQASAEWSQTAIELLKKIHRGDFDKPSYCDIVWSGIERLGVPPETAGHRDSVESPTPHQLRYRSQFAGLVETLLAVIAWGEPIGDEALAMAANDFLHATAAGDWLVPNWKSPKAQLALKYNPQRGSAGFTGIDDKRYGTLERVFPEDWHAGHWAVYDLLGRWQWFSHQARRERRTVSTPICLWLDTGNACLIPYLCVELTLGETGGFLPCMDRLGMTLATRFTQYANGQDLGVEPYAHDFMAAMQRAWVASGMSDLRADSPLKVRGRWWIASRKPFGDQVTVLSGRSAEAATCCALWAALGGRPTDTQPLSGSALRMDDERPITGTIVVKTSPLGHRGLLLGCVGHVLEKALGTLIHNVSGPLIIPEESEWECTDEHRKLVMPLTSLVDAYEQSLAVGRVRSSYVAAVDAEFRGEWLPETLPPRMLSERDGGDMDTPSEPPAAPEDGSIPSDKYRSPYIRTQTIKLLGKTAEPKTCLSAGSFQNQRTDGDDASQGKEHGSDPWKVISREDFLRGLLFDIHGLRRFNRLVVTSDAGMGKSTLLDWICWEFNSPDGDKLAIRLRASELGKSFENKEDLLASSITASENGPPGLLVSQLKRRRDNEEASLTLRRLRSNGRLVLLIDGLDELPENNHACAAIEYLATDPQWRKCLIIVAGRRYAVESQWNKLFPRGNADGWSFILVGELTKPEQEEYLGPTLFKRVNEIASDLLAVPRSLYYLRRYVTNPEGIRTASDVYLTAVVRLVTDGFQSGVPGGGKAAGCLDESGKPILDKEQALKLLSAFAYHLTVVRGHFAEVGANEDVQAIGQLCGISSDESINANYVTQGLRCLSALNGPLRHDLLEGNGVAGFVHFRNKQLQEFLAGLWMSKWIREDQLESLKARLPLSYDKPSQTWYWTFRFAAEMPVRSLAPRENFLGRSDIAWLRSMQTVFCRGDGTPTGTRRSTEMIVRAWPTLWEYVQSGNASAVSLCARWRGEFQEMLDRGVAMAREFTQSFEAIPGGTLKMGSPTTDGARFRNEPKEIPIEIGKFSISLFPMLNGYYRLFDPGHGVNARDRILPWTRTRHSAVSASSRHPVVDVSWWDARAASLWFYWKEEVEGSVKSKKVEFYGTRLPNESELEWVAKDGSEVYQRYPWGDSFSDVYCVPRGGKGAASLPELSSAANHPRSTRRWKIVDIVGNVWQWCDNVYVDDVKTAADCKRTEGGPDRAIRGGSWGYSAGECRSAFRDGNSPGDRDGILGFRLALVPVAKAELQSASGERGYGPEARDSGAPAEPAKGEKKG